MRKNKCILLLIIVLLLITGCKGKVENNTLTCTKEEIDEELKVEEKYIISFSNNKVTSLDMILNFYL